MAIREWTPPVIDETPLTAPIDAPPSNGVESDWDKMQFEPEAIEEGNQLGIEIDVDDDDDNGGIPLDEPVLGFGEQIPPPEDLDPSRPNLDEIEPEATP